MAVECECDWDCECAEATAPPRAGARDAASALALANTGLGDVMERRCCWRGDWVALDGAARVSAEFDRLFEPARARGEDEAASAAAEADVDPCRLGSVLLVPGMPDMGGRATMGVMGCGSTRRGVSESASLQARNGRKMSDIHEQGGELKSGSIICGRRTS